MNASFDTCLTHVLKIEGGFVDRPDDKGGPTKWGITQRTLSDWRGTPAQRSDVLNLTMSETREIYAGLYWDVMKLDQVRSGKLALILFDQGVNHGPQDAMRMLQKVLVDSFGERIVPDGVFGPKTEVAIATANEARLCRKLLQAAQLRYVQFVEKKPGQLVFLEGWLNRTFALWEAIT